jgi:hypothetical protein
MFIYYQPWWDEFKIIWWVCPKCQIIDKIYCFIKTLWLILRWQPLSSKMSHETVNMFIVNPGGINSKLFLTSVSKMIFIIDKIYCLFKNFPLKYDWYKDVGHYLVKSNMKLTICLFIINLGGINSKLFWRVCPKCSADNWKVFWDKTLIIRRFFRKAIAFPPCPLFWNWDRLQDTLL